MSTFLHIIADYGTGDPAFAEVSHRLRAAAPAIDIQQTAVPPFSTTATGFWIAQLGLHNPPFDGLGIYSNTAPRRHDTDRQEDNRGEELVYARLDNDVPVIAVDAGYNLAFIKDRIKELHTVDIDQGGSQFRSRDFFPKAVVSILQGSDEYIGPERDPTDLPEPPASTVAFIDGYGNIKTSLRHSSVEIEPETVVTVTIGDTTREARYTDNTFNIKEGELAVAPGSSGGEDRFIEIFLRGGSAAQSFQQPSTGDTVDLTPARH